MSIFERLRAHFDPAAVSWRPGRIVTNDRGTAGMALAYIDARDVMARLDEAVGPENWSDSYQETAKGVMLCTLSLRINGEWIGKTDGAGETDVEGEKGKVSDAFKRAAVKWGVGRYLYDVPTVWVECDAKSKQITKAGYAQLQEKLAAFGKRYVHAPLASSSAPAAASAEVMDPQTGELTPPAGNVVRDVIKAHEPAPVAAAEPERKPGSPPSCIIPGSKKTPEEIAARKAREKAEAEAEARRHSKAVSDEWCVMLRDVAEAAADPANDTRKLVTDFEAWDLVRKAMWSQIREEDQPPIRKAYLAAKRAIDKRRASKAA